MAIVKQIAPTQDSSPPTTNAAILVRLAEKLPDTVLAYIFPDVETKRVRSALMESAKPARLPSRSATPQTLTFEQSASAPGVPCDKVRLYTDGASRGNPGKAGAGFVIMDPQGVEIAAKSHYLGLCTNNMAEYQALRLGLEEALRLPSRHVEIFLDSELVVRQIEGKYKVKHPGLMEPYHEVKKLLGQFQSFRIHHVMRENNRRADELANAGIDNQQ